MRYLPLAATVFSLMVSAAACKNAAEQPNPAVCGAAGYSWLNPDSMGKVLNSEPLAEASRDKASLTELFNKSGLGFITAKYGVKTYRYAYETQDRGVKTSATAMIGVPDISVGDSPVTTPYILFEHGTCGFSDGCAASNSDQWRALLELLSSQGYAVVGPDYIGMNGMAPASTVKAPYLIGEPTAIASLDALRAAPEMLGRIQARVVPDNRTIIWGPSQGGHATMFTELYAPYYAPKLDIIAAVALIPPARLLTWNEDVIRDFGQGTTYASFTTVSLSRWYRQGDIKDVLVPGVASTLPGRMDTECVITFPDAAKVTDVFTESYAGKVAEGTWNTLEPWYCMYRENSIGMTSVKRRTKTPFFYVTSGNDELVPIDGARKVFDDLCAGSGYSMEYLECKDASHMNGVLWSLPEQLKWMADRLAGKPLSNACVRTAPVCCLGTPDGECKLD